MASDEERLDAMLRALDIKFRDAADGHDRLAAMAREAASRETGKHANPPAHFRAHLEKTTGDKVRYHEAAAETNRRRADYTSAGLLLHGPDERNDVQYMREHQAHVALAHKHSRCHCCDGYDD